jgi:hypothetical protein
MTDPTPHADRDRTEPPPGAWWPPAAPAAYADLDEPVPFVLTDEPVGEAWSLDDGDTGVSILPSAPEGITLQCTLCPHTLADTRGGNLVHEGDGSHTYVPPGEHFQRIEWHQAGCPAITGHAAACYCRHLCRGCIVGEPHDCPNAEHPDRLRAENERLRAVVTRVDGGEIPLGLDALADEVWAWHVRELGEGSTIGKAAKVCEEAGELIGHVIKSTEPRPDAAEHWHAARLEIADVILSAIGAARGLGIGSIDEVVREKWATVSARRFATAETGDAFTPADLGQTEGA